MADKIPLRIFDDLRNDPAFADFGWKYFEVICVKPSPYYNKWINRGEARLNPWKMECSCAQFESQSARYVKGDIRGFCRHLLSWNINSNKKIVKNSLLMLLLENQIKHGPENIIRNEIEGKEIYFGFQTGKEWVNIYINESGWKRFSYNIKTGRWAFNAGPGNIKVFSNPLF